MCLHKDNLLGVFVIIILWKQLQCPRVEKQGNYANLARPYGLDKGTRPTQLTEVQISATSNWKDTAHTGMCMPKLATGWRNGEGTAG